MTKISRTPSQVVMDAARGDPNGVRRQAAFDDQELRSWERMLRNQFLHPDQQAASRMLLLIHDEIITNLPDH